MAQSRNILLVCGEMSGDMHAGVVVRHLRECVPNARVVAMGGQECRDAGAAVVFDYHDFAILGFTGVLASLPRLWKLERALRRRIDAADLFIAVDYPGLNLRLARYAKSRGVPVLFYISPQVWAWGAGRIERMAETVDRLAVILPFEKALFEGRGLDTEFVGHPFVTDHELPPPLPQEARSGIGLLPGSREGEVRRILPAQLGAAKQLRASLPELEFTIARSAAVAHGVYETLVSAAGIDIASDDDPVAVMRRSRLVLVASGTATLQSALFETPEVVVYRVSPINYLLAKRLITIDNIGLVNVVLGERVAPELIQGDATAPRVAAEVKALLEDDARRAAMIARFATLRGLLAGGGGSRRVAEMAAELMGQ